MNVAIDPDMLN